MEIQLTRKHVLWVLINLICLSCYESCLEEERLGLLSIRDYFESNGVKTELVFPSWTDNLSSDCCSWERVECNSTTGRLIELLLNNTRLAPYLYDPYHRIWLLNVSLFLPFEELRNLDLHWNWFTDCYQNHGFEKLSSLNKLEVLDLSYNRFQNNILQSLGQINSLRTLDLSFNRFEGFFSVTDFKGWKNLIVLDLYANRFNSNILPFISSLTSLRTLNLGRNNLEASVSAIELASLENLEQLDLSWNDLKYVSRIVDGLSRLQKLEVLNLRGNPIEKSSLKYLGAITSLKNLCLASCSLDGVFPAQDLASLKNLEILDLSYNYLNGSSELASLENLEHLDLCGNKLTIVDGLSRLQKLEVLNLDGNPITKSSLKSLGALTSLKNLSVAYCNLSGVFPAQDLASLKNIEILDLSRNLLNGSLTMLADLAAFKKLQILNLGYNQFSGDIFQSLRHMTLLKALSLAFNNFNGSLDQEGLCALKNLQELRLCFNNLSGIIPPCLGNLTSLRVLDLLSNKLEGDISSSPLAALTSLAFIDLRYNLFWGQFSFYSIANHTNLEVLMLSSDNHKLEVQNQYSHDWLPTFQLKVLSMSNCRFNNIPQFLTHQTDLRVIDLSHNNLTGTFPNWLLVNNTQLEYLSLRNNSFMGPFHLSSNSSFVIRHIDISHNHFHGQLQQNIGGIIPKVESFNLSANLFEGSVGLSIGSMPYLFYLDLSDNKFSGEFPDTLVTNSSWLGYLLLSNNGFSGEIRKLKSNITSLYCLELSGNQFTGILSNWIATYPSLRSLDINDNFISGEIPRFIGNLSLYQLNIADNALEGTIPCELSTSKLYFFDISNNNLSGTLPSCLVWPSSLEQLNLEGNGFTGSIPEAFFNSSQMTIMNLGNNFLSGEIPSIGKLSYLRVLLLGRNNLSGLIPEQLCQLNKLGILDLSYNSFSGPIPSCFSCISFGKVSTFDFEQNRMLFSGYLWSSYSFQSNVRHTMIPMATTNAVVFMPQAKVDLVIKTRSSTYKGKLLELMSGLDLSCNQLTGKIPAELGNLSWIRALNLSHNQLTGSIPRTLKNFGQIESLDLSHNKLSGEIPLELINLYFLSYFSVAYNNLSGRLPDMKGQFATFGNKSYEGNPFLCGPPLDRNCSADLPQLPPSSDLNKVKWHDIIDPVSFLSSFVATYLIFLLGFWAVLYVNSHWRRRLFLFIENFMDECHFLVVYTIPKLFAKICRKPYFS